MRALALCVLVGCGASTPPPAGDLTIVDEETPTPAPTPEALSPSPDPAVTCLRVADRMQTCTTERAALVLTDLGPLERAQARAALDDAQLAIEGLREQCRGELDEDETIYVQTMGKCLALPCPAWRECISTR